MRAFVIGSILAIGGGAVVAWIDTRPGWDDTGITAGLLFLIAAAAAACGARWYVASLLVAVPILLAEWRTIGTAVIIVLAVTTTGAAAGSGLRRLVTAGRTTAP